MNDTSLVRVEKRATNKVGLLLVLIIAFAGLGVGGYFLYNNKDGFHWPWSFKKEEKPGKEERENYNTSNGKLYLTEFESDYDVIAVNNQPASLFIDKLKATQKGYEIDLKLVLTATPDEEGNIGFADYVVNCDKILIDNYEVSPTFKLNVNLSKKTDKTKIIIPMTELDILEISSFKELKFYLKLDKVDEYGKINTTIGTGRIVGFEEKYDTNIKNVTASFASKDGVVISFYKKEEFSDGTYLYYLVENNNKSQSHKIELKKLLINGKIYEDAEVNVNTHYSSKTIFYIKIPHKDFSDIITIKSSFFILRADEKEQTIFATNDLLIDYSKDETK